MTRATFWVRGAIPIVWAVGMFGARSHPRMSVALAALVLFAAIVVTDRARLVQLLRPTARLAVLGAVAAAVMIGATAALFPLLLRCAPSIAAMSAAIYARFLDADSFGTTLAFVIPLVIAEEVIWRGAFQDGVKLRSQTANVVVLASIYAAAHATFGSPLLVVVAFVCAIYWAGIRAASGSLIPSLLAHLAWDLALVIAPLVPPAAHR